MRALLAAWNRVAWRQDRPVVDHLDKRILIVVKTGLCEACSSRPVIGTASSG